MTIAVLLLYAAGSLQIWHLYVAGFITGAFQSIQFPAYSASISLMLRKEDYARAGAMMGLAESISTVLAPPLAGFLLVLIRLDGIMLIDILTFILAVGALAFVHIPQPPRAEASVASQTSLWQDMLYGFRHIFARPSLLGLQLVFLSINLLAMMGLAGGLIVWMVGAFMMNFFIPLVNGSNQAIWQAKVPPEVQGRVFAARRMIGQLSIPVAYLVAGPLADNIFEPAMGTGGALAAPLGWLVGVGPGAGIGLMFVIGGILGVCVGLGGYLFRTVRAAKTLLPDAVTQPAA